VPQPGGEGLDGLGGSSSPADVAAMSAAHGRQRAEGSVPVGGGRNGNVTAPA
jgi:hypothetical protein